MDWSRPYIAKWRAYEVDKDTWADGDPISGVFSASIEHDISALTGVDPADSTEAPLIDSGTIEFDARPNAGFSERYVRLVMAAEQDGERTRVEVATLLCTSSSGVISHGRDTLQVQGNSVLYPASVALMERGAYVPKGMNCMEWVRSQLASVLHAPVVASGGFTLAENYVLDVGCSVRRGRCSALAAGPYRSTGTEPCISGRGPQPRRSSSRGRTSACCNRASRTSLTGRTYPTATWS